MRITFSVDGGFAVFPGLSRPVSFEVDGLPTAEADAFRSVVAKSDFFARNDSSAPPTRGAADEREYQVTIEDGLRRRSLTIPESVDQPDLKELICLLDRQRYAQRPARRPA